MKQSAEHPFLISHNSPILQEERAINGWLADWCPGMEYIYEICTHCLRFVLFWIERAILDWCMWFIYLYSSGLFADVEAIRVCFLSPILKLKSLAKLSQRLQSCFLSTIPSDLEAKSLGEMPSISIDYLKYCGSLWHYHLYFVSWSLYTWSFMVYCRIYVRKVVIILSILVCCIFHFDSSFVQTCCQGGNINDPFDYLVVIQLIGNERLQCTVYLWVTIDQMFPLLWLSILLDIFLWYQFSNYV